MTETPEEIARRLHRMNLCDPECEGRCVECPQTIAGQLVDAISAERSRYDRLKEAAQKMAALLVDLSDKECVPRHLEDVVGDALAAFQAVSEEKP